ncbi:hypothetical protein BDV38DRAFT_283162 [Aspergillus pseudotamarii]|uniref:Secreted protein n=1 Tax=Aspergillus pseudotamarii TaxID=132259 RepID=A0A5N6SVA6_ASPPS|nr:uncharacterized protein BDV38DRAFT_283162 [Aspergillus pseudotamarii]KAE8137323.1 hypothetical protein BDV38DRAFT_283162 [Aspergillus pseudotamarii]
MRWISSFISFLVLCISASNAMVDKMCMDNMGAIGQVAQSQLGPVFNAQVCSKGIKPSKADWKWLEPHMQAMINNVRKCSQKPDLPNYKPKFERLADHIVMKCTRPSHNYCKADDLKEVKSCVVGEALGWGMMNMDMLKYVDKRNCEKLVPCLKNPNTWTPAKQLIKEYARYKKAHA